MKFQTRLRSFFDTDHGSSLVEFALVAPILVLLLLSAVDFGKAYYLATEVAGAAHAGAEYGSQAPTDIAGIAAAAAADAPDVPNLTVATPTYGCECSDGAKYSANCSSKPTCGSNVVYSVKVSVSSNYKPLLAWPGIPASVQLSSSAIMRSAGS